MPLKLNSFSGGSVTLDSASTSLDFTHTLPAETGTIITTSATTGVNAAALSTGTVPFARLPAGSIVQTVYARTDARTFYTSLISGNGTTVTDLNISITPRSATNRLIVQWMINAELHQDNVILIHRDGALITTAGEEGRNSISNNRWVGYASAFYDQNEDSTPSNWLIQYSQIAGSTAARTYAPAVRSSSGTQYTLALNRTIGSAGGGQDFYENMVSTAVIYEVLV